MSDYLLSDTGVKVWRSPDCHPLLGSTDVAHPAFRGKLSETYSRGKVRGLPRILSRNSEDALTWVSFSPLLANEGRRSEILGNLLRLAFSDEVSRIQGTFANAADLTFWPKLRPPPDRTIREGPSEPDIMIILGRVLILVEAKYKSGVSTKTTYDNARDQVIRLVDVGSWHAGMNGLESAYVIVLQYGDAETNAEEIVGRYRGNSEAIRRALPYRSDLKESDFQRLACSISFVRWPDPWNGLQEN